MLLAHSKTLNEIPQKLADDKCYACRVLESAEGRRVYFDDDAYLIFENLSTMTPILVAKDHGASNIPFQAFQDLKDICSKLYGDCYCLQPEPVENEHYLVKVVRLTSTIPAV